MSHRSRIEATGGPSGRTGACSPRRRGCPALVRVPGTRDRGREPQREKGMSAIGTGGRADDPGLRRPRASRVGRRHRPHPRCRVRAAGAVDACHVDADRPRAAVGRRDAAAAHGVGRVVALQHDRRSCPDALGDQAGPLRPPADPAAGRSPAGTSTGAPARSVGRHDRRPALRPVRRWRRFSAPTWSARRPSCCPCSSGRQRNGRPNGGTDGSRPARTRGQPRRDR